MKENKKTSAINMLAEAFDKQSRAIKDAAEKLGELKINVENLAPGDLFKWEESQRNFRKVMNVRELDKHDHIPPVGRKMLVLYDNCKQLSILKGTQVIKEK